MKKRMMIGAKILLQKFSDVTKIEPKLSCYFFLKWLVKEQKLIGLIIKKPLIICKWYFFECEDSQKQYMHHISIKQYLK